MMVTRADIPSLLAPFGFFANFSHGAKLLVRHALDRLRHERGTRPVMGNALVARLLYSLRRAAVPISFDAALTEIVQQDGRIVGALVESPAGRRAIRAPTRRRARDGRARPKRAPL